jgi:Protein of unknown function (DUF1553)/Protein of unknown function (DUF1549)/Planctomycete cytochrome C/F5/8 type C domain
MRRTFTPAPFFLASVLLLFCCNFGQCDSPESTAPVDFKTDIRPILSNRCFACHGPDDAHVESGLRLHEFSLATAPAQSGAKAIVPKSLSESEMIRRISSNDEAERMPPPHFGAKLTEREIELFKRWVASGAEYSKHWSFDQIKVSKLETSHSMERYPDWQGSAIDLHILKKLDEKGWTPTPKADGNTLLRRLSLDLTGLPPTLEQQKAFQTDASVLAYERLVDELLASPAFGEHWGRKWLDLARYADSAGYADDPPRTIWAYRDWVIKAINDGMPFDQFTIEQLAGDLLPNPTDEQFVATAFHRNTLTNNEGGTNDEEFRNVAVVDRVNTTMAVWMGVTMACAQCHTHKFDPITQTEYFQVFAILNQTKDADRGDESPILRWFTHEQRRDQQEWQRELSKVELALGTPDESLIPEQLSWAQLLRKPIRWQTAKPESAVATSKSPITIQENGNLKVDTIADKDTYTLEWRVPNDVSVDALSGLQIQSIPNPSLPNGGAAIGDGNFVLTNVSASLFSAAEQSTLGRFVRIELFGENKILSLAEVQVFSRDEIVSKGAAARQSTTDFEGKAERAVDGNPSGKYTDNSTTHTAISSNPWWEVDLGKAVAIDKIVIWNRTDGDVGNRLDGATLSIMSEDRKTLWESQLEKPQASQLIDIQPSIKLPIKIANADYAQENFPAYNAIDADAKSGWAVGGAVNQPHQLNLALDTNNIKELTREKAWAAGSTLRLTLKFESTYRRAVLASFGIGFTTDDRAERLMGLPSNIVRLLSQDPQSLSKADQNSLHSFYVSTIALSRQPLRTSRDSLSKKLAEIKPITTVPILSELEPDKLRQTHVQIRGNYKVKGDLVSAGVPKAFHAWKPTNTNGSTPKMDRLEFARWLMQPDNPLTARVIANRYWENFFGVGIVRTSEEFGSQGDLPSNPELLDYLATDLIRNGWDTKRFIRNIVLSAAYQQRSYVSPKRYEEDPDNVFVSRGPRFRVTAEQVRDMALASAGLLSHRLYGPPARPPQPSLGLTAAFGGETDWDTSKGEDRFRRGLYTLWRRSNPYPSMATFDAPNREVCVLKRDRTNTPLQALVTLNDPAYVEAAQGLARCIVLYDLPTATVEERIERIFELTLSRRPNAREIEAMSKLYHETRTELATELDRATKLATEPIGPLPPNSDAIELATWTTICNVVLNLDEFLMTP